LWLTFKLASWFWTSPPSPSPSHPGSSSKIILPQQEKPRIQVNRRMSAAHRAAQTPVPELSPSLCFNTSYLQDFLRISRAQLDDTINTSLNSLLTPSLTSPFDPLSTSDPSTNRRGKQTIPSNTCYDFTQQTIFPIWSARSKVLSYCSIVATSPDPDDPDGTVIAAQNMAQSHKVVNERLDPYSGRFFPKEPRTEMLGSLLRNENAVEGIVRDRTWRILNERCVGLDPAQRGWQDAFTSWEQQKKNSQ